MKSLLMKFLILAIWGASTLWLLSGNQVHATECGRLESSLGPVEILRVKDVGANSENVIRHSIKASSKAIVDCTDVVVTQAKARAKIRLKGNVVLTMGPHSRMSIEEFAQKSGNPTLLHLTYGKMRALFQDSEAGKAAGKKETQDKKGKAATGGEVSQESRFRIRTSTAVAGVRGTDFFVSFEPNTRVTEQATITGKVEVEQIGTGQKVEVPAGNQVAVEQVVQPSPITKTPSESTIVPPPAAVPIKKLEVKPIDTQVVTEIRQTSILVKADAEFTTQEAVKVLGAPEQWQPSAKELPFDLKELKEEF